MLFGIFFVMFFKYVFGVLIEGIYLCIRLDGNLFNFFCFKVKIKVCDRFIWDMLFVDDVVVVIYIQEEL